MPDKVSPGPLRGNPVPKEAVCIHTKKVYDSCRDKECLQDIRVYLTRSSQSILDGAISVKPRTAEILWTYIDVEEIPFNKGFYTVDVTYFYRIVCDAYYGAGRPKEISGLARYDKRTVLFGSEGSARIFSSQYMPNSNDIQFMERSNMPIAVVEVVEPVILGAKVLERESNNSNCCCCCEIPESICGCFEDDLMVADDGKRLFVTLGQFSIIKLERDIQLLMPAYNICMPEKECAGIGGTEDPCELFASFKFPVDEFFPPRQSVSSNGGSNTGCGTGGSCNTGNCNTGNCNTGGCSTGGCTRRR